MAAIALMALGSVPLGAASSQIWKNRTRSEREQGDLKGVSLAADGTLSLGPAFEMLASAADPYLWSVARDSRGTIYAGGGNEGKVYRLGEFKVEGNSIFSEAQVRAVIGLNKGDIADGE